MGRRRRRCCRRPSPMSSSATALATRQIRLHPPQPAPGFGRVVLVDTQTCPRYRFNSSAPYLHLFLSVPLLHFSIFVSSAVRRWASSLKIPSRAATLLHGTFRNPLGDPSSGGDVQPGYLYLPHIRSTSSHFPLNLVCWIVNYPRKVNLLTLQPRPILLAVARRVNLM